MQVQGMNGVRAKYRNGLHCYTTIFREEGIAAFFRGNTANIVRAVPNAALQFGAFEGFKTFLKKAVDGTSESE